jgi:hypothetical protein
MALLLLMYVSRVSAAMARADSDAPDGSDGAMQGQLLCGVMWIGSEHCYRSHRLSIHGLK